MTTIVSGQDLKARIANARKEFDARTASKPGEKADPMGGIVRTFFLSVIFPQLGKQAEKDPERTYGAIVEMIGTLVTILGLTAEELFPERLGEKTEARREERPA